MVSATYLNFRGTPRKRLLVEACVLVLLAAAMACSTGMGQNSTSSRSSSSNPTSGNVSVSVEPGTTTLTPAARQQYTATVQGTSNTAVNWSASAGLISSSGLYTAPAVSHSLQITVTATSVADPARHASSTVTLQPASSLAILTSALAPAVTSVPYFGSLAASGGTAPYQWSISAGAMAPGMQLNASTGALSGTPNQTGQFSFTIKATDAASHTATQKLTLAVLTVASGSFDGPAELPRAYMQSAMSDTPASGSVIKVPAGGSLQAALNAANCGDTIQLQAGATYEGLALFPNKPCDDQHWIIVRTSAPDSSLTAEGVRMTPCYAGVASLPGRPSFACPGSMPSHALAKISWSGGGDGPIQIANGANHYRLTGLEITRDDNGKSVTDLISQDLNPLAAWNHFVFDRLWVHGVALTDTRRGLSLNGASQVAVVDSYFNDLHCWNTCVDSQAIAGGNGNFPMGTWEIYDNFLEAGAEGIEIGGGAATLTASDIVVSSNHFFKPMTWLEGQPGYIGEKIIVKNHFELKNAQRVLYEYNISQNVWGGFTQKGYSILLTPKNPLSAETGQPVCPICLVTDVTIRYSHITNVGSGLQIANAFTGLTQVVHAADGERYSIHDIIADSFQPGFPEVGGAFAEIQSITPESLQHVHISHITAFAPTFIMLVGAPVGHPINDLVFENNIVLAGSAPIWDTGFPSGTAGCSYQDNPATTVVTCFANSVFNHNAVLAASSLYPPSRWPAGQFFSAVTEVGFLNFNNGHSGNYQLMESSPYVAAANDGSPLGANVSLVMNALVGVQ